MSNLTTIGPNEMQFLDSSIPVLTGGTYRIDVTHDITEKSYGVEGNYKLSQEFKVLAARFALPPGSVQGQYPMPDSRTDFHTNLPYIVFNEQNLPWARQINGDTGSTPWMALMIFRADEIIYDNPINAMPNPTLSTMRTVKTEVAGYDKNKILGPDIKLDNELERNILPALRANTIDVLASTFQQLAPTLAELEYLAHIRKINSGGLVADGQTGERTYANLLANRLANPNNEALYYAHLVSLEGWAEYLPGATPAKTLPADQKLRLVSLYSWKFNNKKEGVSFGRLMKKMSSGTLQLRFDAPAAWPQKDTDYTDAQKQVKARYADGYVALNHDTRTGEKSFAWYRGPFSPVKPVIINNIKPVIAAGDYLTHITSADKAMIYDAKTGVFDQSYAVAWELGRLLTLANRPAAIAIWQWKKQGMKKLQVLNLMIGHQLKRKRKLLGAEATLELNALLDGVNWLQLKDDLMDDQAGKYIFMNYLGRRLGKHILGTGGENGPAVAILDPSGVQKHLEKLPGVLSKGELQSALENGTDPHVAIFEKLDAAHRVYSTPKQD